MMRFAGVAIAVVLLVTGAVLGINEFNIMTNHEQLLYSCWTFLGIVFGTGLMVPVATGVCDVLKRRKEMDVDKELQKTDKDNQAQMDIAKMKMKLSQGYKEVQDGLEDKTTE